MSEMMIRNISIGLLSFALLLSLVQTTLSYNVVGTAGSQKNALKMDMCELVPSQIVMTTVFKL